MSRHIVVLGAGISGLAIAWFIKQHMGSNVRLTLIEKSSRVGGWIQTIQNEGFLFEQGPRSCRSKGTGQETLALIEALGVQEEVLVPQKEARDRYIYGPKGLQRLPRHLWEIPFNFLTRGWLKALRYDLRQPKCEKEDESIQAFFSRRLGQSWTETLIDPFVSGIYAGDCSRLSLKSCFPLFDLWEEQQGSLLRGAWHHHSPHLFQSPFIQSISRFPLFSFKQGMETLPRSLAQHLNDCLLTKQEVVDLSFHSNEIEIKLENGKQMTADHLISTLPTFALSALVSNYPLLAKKLNELSYTTVVVVNIGYETQVLPLKGFGYLIPSKMGLLTLGCIWDSSLFPQQNSKEHQTRLTVMLGGSHHPEVEQMSEHMVVECALQSLYQHLGIRANPRIVQVKKARTAIPQFEVGFSKWKKEIQETTQRLSSRLILSGSAFTGVSINDCIAQARQLAQQFTHISTI
jgi:oxygen-dependent protoporphyrinogen oxidase